MGEMVTVPAEKYKKLLETFLRVKIFSEYVNSEKYSIDREDCGMFLGFTVENKEE